MNRQLGGKNQILIFTDIMLVNLSYVLAFYFKYSNDLLNEKIVDYRKSAILITLVYLVFFYLFKLYKNLWNYAGTYEFLIVIISCFLANITFTIINVLVGFNIELTTSFLGGIFSVFLIGGLRITIRIYSRYIKDHDYFKRVDNKEFKRVMIVGAGTAGAMIVKEMKLHKEMKLLPVVVIDDDRNKLSNSIGGVKISGNRNDIKIITKEMDIDTILIAIPSLDKKNKKEIIDICKETNCKLEIIPGIYELIDGQVTLNEIREVSYEDLLGRNPVKLDIKGIGSFINNKRIMITGGGGSIGSEICRQIAKFKPKEVVLLDNYENGVYELQQEFKYFNVNINIKCVIASIRDRKRLENIFKEYKPQIIFHAAAHKHVPLMEDNPEESVKNNVFGTLNLAECSDKYKVERFVMISTDKAVNPTNIMGATKRLCEMIIQSMDKKSNTQFVVVRFGNVLGSNGSVVPLFKKQIAQGGPVTVTHPDINRFFMTIPEAAQLVLQASVFAEGGEIFVLDMDKPIKIYDMACDLIRLSGFEPNVEIKIKFIGLRPGEKLYEEVLTDEEGLNKTVHEKIFIGRPTFTDYETLKFELEELRFVTESGRKEEIEQKIQELVPTYKKTTNDTEVVVSL